MFTAKQYRAKAAEYREYLNASRSPAETSEFRNLEQTYTILADNEEWLALNAEKIAPASDYDIVPTREDEQDKRVIPVKDDERILRPSIWCRRSGRLFIVRHRHASDPPVSRAL